jgi:LemA protein
MAPVRWAWVAAAVAGAVLLYGVLTFNRLVALRNRVRAGWSQIDVQLRRRYDLSPNLVETVRGYAAHERELFERVAEDRARAIEAAGVRPQADAEDGVTRGLRRLLAVAEAYPELRASEQFLALQEELTATESKIAYARQFYNDQVMRLNTLVGSFPSSLVARLFGFRPGEFFDIEDPVRGPVAVEP